MPATVKAKRFACLHACACVPTCLHLNLGSFIPAGTCLRLASNANASASETEKSEKTHLQPMQGLLALRAAICGASNVRDPAVNEVTSVIVLPQKKLRFVEAARTSRFSVVQVVYAVRFLVICTRQRCCHGAEARDSCQHHQAYERGGFRRHFAGSDRMLLPPSLPPRRVC